MIEGWIFEVPKKSFIEIYFIADIKNNNQIKRNIFLYYILRYFKRYFRHKHFFNFQMSNIIKLYSYYTYRHIIL